MYMVIIGNDWRNAQFFMESEESAMQYAMSISSSLNEIFVLKINKDGQLEQVAEVLGE